MRPIRSVSPEMTRARPRISPDGTGRCGVGAAAVCVMAAVEGSGLKPSGLIRVPRPKMTSAARPPQAMTGWSHFMETDVDAEDCAAAPAALLRDAGRWVTSSRWRSATTAGPSVNRASTAANRVRASKPTIQPRYATAKAAATPTAPTIVRVRLSDSRSSRGIAMIASTFSIREASARAPAAPETRAADST